MADTRLISDFELMELINAKFCHDLSGPIGALNNGVEFLHEEKAEMRQRAIHLIEISAKEAVDRLQFYRQAFGTVQLVGETNFAKLKILVDAFFSSGKITVDWQGIQGGLEDNAVSHKLGKLILNVILICSSILIYGGKISIAELPASYGKLVRIRATGNTIKVDPDINKIVTTKDRNIMLTSRNVHYYFTVRLADHIHSGLSFSHENESVEFTIHQLHNAS